MGNAPKGFIQVTSMVDNHPYQLSISNIAAITPDKSKPGVMIIHMKHPIHGTPGLGVKTTLEDINKQIAANQLG